MGMFDYIKCAFTLPLPENQGALANWDWRENQFQTKDLDRVLEEYRIDEEGRFWQQTYSGKTARTGRTCRNAAGWQPANTYTGMVRFYDSIYTDKADYWVEWRAVLVLGKLTEIKLHSWEERDNRERLAFEAQCRLEEERRGRFLATWVGRHLYPLYAWLVHIGFARLASRICHWVSDLSDRALLRLDRLADKLAPYGDPIRAKQWRTERQNDGKTE